MINILITIIIIISILIIHAGPSILDYTNTIRYDTVRCGAVPCMTGLAQ